jgi:hypothetical protein
MRKIRWSEEVTNEEVIDPIGEKRTLLTIIPPRRPRLDWTYLKTKLPSS